MPGFGLMSGTCPDPSAPGEKLYKNLTVCLNAAIGNRIIFKNFSVHRTEKHQKKECADRDSNPGLGVGNA